MQKCYKCELTEGKVKTSGRPQETQRPTDCVRRARLRAGGSRWLPAQHQEGISPDTRHSRAPGALGARPAEREPARHQLPAEPGTGSSAAWNVSQQHVVASWAAAQLTADVSCCLEPRHYKGCLSERNIAAKRERRMTAVRCPIRMQWMLKAVGSVWQKSSDSSWVSLTWTFVQALQQLLMLTLRHLTGQLHTAAHAAALLHSHFPPPGTRHEHCVPAALLPASASSETIQLPCWHLHTWYQSQFLNPFKICANKMKKESVFRKKLHNSEAGQMWQPNQQEVVCVHQLMGWDKMAAPRNQTPARQSSAVRDACWSCSPLGQN